jgi:D-galactarolactone cycloisomerase
MRIVDVEAIAIKAANPDGRTYWGKASWGSEAGSGPSDPLRHWQPTKFPHPGRMRPAYSDGFETTLVRIETDTGLVGWGEAKAPVAPRVTKAIIEDLFREMLLGADPRNVEVIWETLYASMRLRGHDGGFLVEAISGVDIALWDIIGKATGEPVHRLLGGAYRDRVMVYASGVPATRASRGEADYQRMLEAAQSAIDRGFLGLKMAIGVEPDADIASVAAVRELVGPKMAIFSDAAGNYDVGKAVRVGRELEKLGVGFLEAPLPHENVDGYAEIARELALPIANDVITSRYQVLDYLKKAALDVVQPDVCRTGGITELKRIAVLTDAFGVAFTPHVSIGSAIHFVASIHCAAAVPNLHQMEFWFGQNPLGDALLREPVLAVRNGHVAVPQGPGLGIEIDEEKVRALALGAVGHVTA